VSARANQAICPHPPIREDFPPGLRVVPTGIWSHHRHKLRIVFDQIRAALALVVIFAVMALMLLSARVGLLAILLTCSPCRLLRSAQLVRV
jgi:hypothetical protein